MQFSQGIVGALLLAGTASGISLRVVTFNLELGLGEAGTVGHEAAKAILARIDGDVVALQEVYTGDFNSGNPSNLDSFASDLGYPYLSIGERALDSQSRVVLISKFPFVTGSTGSILSPPGANDMTRGAAVAKVDVPGTDNDPVLVTAHLKCCFDLDDPFRRAVEMIRIRKYLDASGLDGSDNIFVLGDFNLLGNNQSFSSQPAGLPASYVLGNDITFDVRYYADPVDYFEGLVNPGYRHQNGTGINTYVGGSVLDHLLISSSIAARNPMTEIFNSKLDANFPGLAKAGNALLANTSANASDHYALFGDFELDGGGMLTVTLEPTDLAESSPPATVTVTLAESADSPVTIFLNSSDPTEATLENAILTFAPGETIKSTTLIPQRDGISDGAQALDLRATGSGFAGVTVRIVVEDSDNEFYSLASFGTPVIDSFEDFSGEAAPAEWSTEGIAWLGPDDGSSGIPGGRSYGTGSMGVIALAPIGFTTKIRNETGTTVDALEISYSATQWRAFENGSADRWEVTLIGAEDGRPLPKLGFVSDNLLATGALAPPVSQTRRSYLRGLDLEAGEELSLRFTAFPGSGGGVASDDVFINEFHYDNAGDDQGEFVEIVVGPAFAGELSEVLLHLYNGNAGTIYGTAHRLSDFRTGAIAASGHRFFWKEIAGLQNGSPDGFALVANGVVREFLSYEGTISATGGPAMGLTSLDVGISQTNSNPAGRESIIRSGKGNDGSDFPWSSPDESFTPGQPNPGQFFGSPPQPQGIGVDDFSVTALVDSDGDLLPDAEESEIGTDPQRADSDGDGQDDFFESVLTLTDPLRRSSRLEIRLGLDSSGVVSASIPTLAGRHYRIESSSDLIDWSSGGAFAGDGGERGTVFPEGEKLFFRVRISAP